MNGETLFGILSEGGAVLNPGSAYGVQWTQDQLAALLGKPVRRTIKKDTKVLLGSPSERPEKLIRQLTEVFESDPRILEAWLALAHWPNDNTMTWYLDVRSQSKPDDISSTIARAVNGTELTDKPIDVVVNLPSASEGTGVRIKPTSLH